MRSVGLKNTPSVQHTVALIGPDVPSTVRNFEALEATKIDFNYRPAGQLYKPLMEGAFSTEQAVTQCLLLKNRKGAKANAGLIKAFGEYAGRQKATWFNIYPTDFFPISPTVRIPVNPSGFWAAEGQLRVLWVQPWKGRTLDHKQRAIFHTILAQRVFVGDDFGSAELEWVDTKAPCPKSERVAKVLHRKDFELLTDAELKASMDILLEAFTIFAGSRDRQRDEERKGREPPPAPLFR